MPWAAVILVFFLTLVLWIGSGFVGRDLSFTFTFFPAFYAILGIYWLRRLATGGTVDLRRDETAYVWLALLLFTATLLPWAVGTFRAPLQLRLSLFNLLIPGTLSLLCLLVWLTPLDRRKLRAVLAVLVVFAGLNGAVSVVTFAAANLFRWVPAEVFFINPRYPVILYDMGGESWVRTPGLFETGGSNGSFLLLTLALTLSWLLFAPREPRRRGRRRLGWSLVAIQGALVLATLTRRSFLALGLLLGTLGTASLLLGRRVRLVLLLVLCGAAATAAIYVAAPDLFTTRTLSLRLGFWSEGLHSLEAGGAITALVGYGVTQSGLERVVDPRFPLIDNTFLALWIYGGVVYVFANLAYYGALFITNLRLARTAPPRVRWLAVFAIGLFAVAVTTSMFSTFLTNITESFLYVLTLSLTTKYALKESRSHDSHRAAVKAGRSV